MVDKPRRHDGIMEEDEEKPLLEPRPTLTPIAIALVYHGLLPGRRLDRSGPPGLNVASPYQRLRLAGARPRS